MPYRPAERFHSVSYAIRDVLGPARELERKGHRVLHLNIGDPCKFDFAPPAELVEALRESAGESYYADSEGLPETRAAIARYESSRGVAVGADDVIVTTGVSEALALVASSVLNAGDELLIPGPVYPPYVSVPLIYGARTIEYRARAEDGWVPDVAAVERAITPRTRAIVLISPNNPTGATWPADVLREIAEIAWQRQVLVVTDDMYWELAFDGHPTTAGALTGGPVVVLNGMSKSWLVPGWRTGYIAFRDSGGELDAIQETVMKQARLRLCTATPVQRAIAKCLRAQAPHLADLRSKLASRAKLVVERVAETDALDLVAPTGAFYAFIRIADPGKRTDKQWVLELLAREKVLVVPGSGFGSAGTGHFRMVILPPPDVLDDAMDRIVRFAEAKS